jgi:ABC-2 type transport system permease protein
MNIFIKELKGGAKALIIWSVCMFLLILAGMEKFTGLSSGGQNINQLFTNMPYSIKALFGIGSFDLSKLSGYYAVMFEYIEITAAIHAALLGADIISKEESGKTTEFLMAKPVSRAGVITPKLFAALVDVAVLNLVSLFSTFASVAAQKGGSGIFPQISVSIASMFFVQLIFLSLGVFIAAFSQKPKSSGSAAVGILLGAYVISMITGISDKLNVLNLLSPFKYFDLKAIINGQGLDAGVVAASVALIAVFTVCSYICYNKRDLSV